MQMDPLDNSSVTSTSGLTAKRPRISEEKTSNYGAASADDRKSTSTANYNGCSITQLPPELHLMISKYLDSKSMMNLRKTCTQFSQNIRKAEVLSKIKLEKAASLREALRIDSIAGNNLVDTLWKKGARLPPDELAQALREALRMDSMAGNNHVLALKMMGATLPPEELTQALRETLRMDSMASTENIFALKQMGATIPPEERKQALREAMRMNTPTSNFRVFALWQSYGRGRAWSRWHNKPGGKH